MTTSKDMLTYDDMVTAMKYLDKPPSVFDKPFTAYGMPVYIPPPPPQKIKLSEAVNVSDEFRQSMNDYFAIEFGYRDGLVERGTVLIGSEFGIVINRDDIGILAKGAIV